MRSPRLQIIPGLVLRVVPDGVHGGRLSLHEVFPLGSLMAFLQVADEIQHLLGQIVGQRFDLFHSQLGVVHDFPLVSVTRDLR